MKTASTRFCALLLLLTGGALHAQQYTWTTLAGQPGVIGSADGVGTNALFKRVLRKFS